MKSFWRLVSPKRAVSDFADQWSRPTPHRWQILGVACAATFAIFATLIPPSERAVIPKPDVIYISTFDESRSDAEIIAENCANQERKDAFRERVAQSEQARREMYETLGRATFMDMDTITEEAEAQRSAEAAARARAREEAGLLNEEELAVAVEEYCSRADG